MAGDYLKYQFNYSSKVTDRQILATDTSTELNNLITPKSPNHALFIQAISFSETTESNGKSLTFQDDSGTPIVLGKYNSITLAGGVAKQVYLDFGPRGYQLGTGKNFDVIVSAAGIAGALHVEAYERLIGPVAPASTN